MEEVPYSNRELDEKFRNILEKMDEHFEATTGVQSKILEQTTKTNGSVGAVKSSQKWMQGSLYTLGAVLTVIVIPTLGYFAVLTINNQAKLAAISALVHVLSK